MLLRIVGTNLSAASVKPRSVTGFVARAKAQLDGRLRARGLAPRVSHRSAGPDAENVYRRACAEIGCAP